MTTQVSEEVQKISNIMRENMNVNEHGVIEMAEGTLDKCLIGTDVDLGMIEKVNTKRDTLIAAHGLATGEMGLENFIKHPTLAQVSSTLNIGGDACNATYQRERKLPDGEGGMRVGKGVLSLNYKVAGQTSTRDPLKGVRAHLAAEAKRILAD